MSSVFSKIIAGELPGRFVYRDQSVVAFLTIEPLALGHTLVVPVQEVDKWTDLDPEVWARVNQVAQQVGQAIITAFGSRRAGLIIAGFDVPHTHIHVFPANSMDDYNMAHVMQDVPEDAMDAAAAQIRQALADMGVAPDGAA